jgi:hypothetical protein
MSGPRSEIKGTNKRDLVFKEGPNGGGAVGKTYRTYNAKTKYHFIYAPATQTPAEQSFWGRTSKIGTFTFSVGF